MYYKYLYTAFLLVLVLTGTGCRKYLDLEPKGKMIPATLKDFQLLLEDNEVMNSTPGLPTISADELSFRDQILPFLNNLKKAYLWEKELFTPLDQVPDWSKPYKQIYTANTILEGLEKSGDESAEALRIKGAALFHRALAHSNLVKQFAKSYDAATSASDLGVPLRTKTSIDVEQRATVKAVYEQVLADLEIAADLLPETVKYKNLPSKYAALGLLARVHLTMGNYDKAASFASSYLQVINTLLDFNSIVTKPNYEDDPEVTFFANLVGLPTGSGIGVDTGLINLYSSNDLRKKVFYRPPFGPITTYSPRSLVGATGIIIGYFAGISTAEIYLIRAESNARLGNLQAAMDDVNSLLVTRHTTGTYVNKTAATAIQALKIIFEERRKDLPFTNNRWFDLQRKNKDPLLAETLKRTALGQSYVLPPNDKLYTFPIPPAEIIKSGMPQNER